MNKIKKIYTVATAHLDTCWLWNYEKSISTYIPDTLRENFKLFEKFPDYKFNFEGSNRYEIMEEYYPEEFKKLKGYVKEGRWHPCGSCYENGDGVPQNYDEAVKWYRKAAQQGNEDAQEVLKEMGKTW